MLLGVDVGGTFTDAVLASGGRLVTAKSPTTPADQSEGVMAAVSAALRRAGASTGEVAAFAHGMTVATNALLEGRGARTALVATEGFADVVELGRQARADLYRLCAAHPAPLVPPERRVAAPERCGPDGVLRALADPAALAEEVAALEPEAVAVVLLHAYAHPAHERAIGDALAARLPDVHVSLSHEVVGTFREYERAATTEVDAALSPLLARYLRRLVERTARAGLPEPRIMQSNGGLAAASLAARHAAFTVLSGPAGGAAAAALVARASGHRDLVCFDMGGTSCDVCVVEDGAVRETAGREVGGRPLALPIVDIHTVGAGGGSVAWRDPGGALRVGPRSAGADPGPACYGRGGVEPTVTDANLLLGRLDAAGALAGGVTLDRDAAERAVGSLARELGLPAIACAEGVVRVANAEMVRALRVMTVQQGIDPRDYALLAFGGAGPLHAAAIADELGMTTILCPRASGVLSALGLAAADRRATEQRTVLLAGGALTDDALRAARDELVAAARATLSGDAAPGDTPAHARNAALATAHATAATPDDVHMSHDTTAAPDPLRVAVAYDVRYRGQAHELTVRDLPDVTVATVRAAFEDLHEERYGYRDPDAPTEVVTIRATASVPGPQLDLAAGAAGSVERSRRRVVFDATAHEAEIVRGEPGAGERIRGPAICELPEATLAVPPGWAGSVDKAGTIVLERTTTRPGRLEHLPHAQVDQPSAEDPPASLDPISLQVVTGALRAACEEMGAALVRSAHSANIKERRDCSCGLFDAAGEMVMQAEHIPVHLGAMPAAVAAVLDEDHVSGPHPPRSWILNDPFRGGTHLPDITVVTPVLDPASGALLGFAANRAHHADVGGRTPGSMPADSTTLDEEGVVIAPRVLDEAAIDELVALMRQPDQRRADLRAQLAANRIGARRLVELAQRLGTQQLREATAAVLDYAERRTRACIAALPDGPREARDVLEGSDGDVELRLTATVHGDRLVLDFAGSARQHAGNLNCPLAVTRSAAYFAVRVLTDPDVPPSAGAYRPIEVRARLGSLLNAQVSPGGVAPAVAGGNVETSSRVADLVLAAFGRALGQGTMNNVTLGSERDDEPASTSAETDAGARPGAGFTYYETLGGGQGACADADGPSAVHVAMSNTLNTPAEALELEFPLRVVRHAIRRGSGGAGQQRGGDGLVRELEALAPMSYALITERRRHAPPGAAGGRPGARGRNLLNGHELPSKAAGELQPGDRLTLETPGGGGHGERPTLTS
ncbi:MAG: hydantoinase B/oxoprolinase family protein [Solirubrobacteraceae bacterium]|nr:hydantoinase B/oxoprolinase family protein [Solirubrobacteraceae bacterium]